jgi:rhodanese-related sulfurtransferase
MGGVLAGLALVAAAAVGHAQGPINFSAAVDRITIADFKKLLGENGTLVVDVRDQQSYQLGHIPGAILIPLADLPAKAADLKKEKRPIVTYCS